MKLLLQGLELVIPRASFLRMQLHDVFSLSCFGHSWTPSGEVQEVQLVRGHHGIPHRIDMALADKPNMCKNDLSYHREVSLIDCYIFSPWSWGCLVRRVGGRYGVRWFGSACTLGLAWLRPAARPLSGPSSFCYGISTFQLGMVR